MKHRLGWILFVGTAVGVGLIADGNHATQQVVAQSVDEGCPETSTPQNQTGSLLQTFAEDSASGVIYDGTGSRLQLAKEGGLFSTASLAITDKFNTAAVADFDNDGWTDLVVGTSSDAFLRFYKNRTYESPAPDWTDPSQIRTPKFVRTTDVVAASSDDGNAGMTAGDFDQDGNYDFFYYKNRKPDDSYIDIQKIYLGRGNGTFKSGYNATSTPNDLGYFAWSSTNSTVFDWNKDGWPDIIFGTKMGSANSGGTVMALLNDCPDVWTSKTTKCSQTPNFVRTDILTNIDLGNKGVNALTMADYTGDGVTDMVIGSPSSCAPLRLYKGLSGGGIDTSSYDSISNSPYSEGAATVLLSADFTLNGGQDLVFGTDNFNCGSNMGGAAYLHKNDLGPTPFSGGADKRLSQHGNVIGGVTVNDFDLGVVLDYDQDPDKTKDFLIADGNDSGSFYMFANRVVAQFVECGEVESGVLDLGGLSDEEMVVTSARMTPAMSVPGGAKVTFFMSNEEPANWQLAAPCVDDANDYCVSFPKPVGREVRWKAEMCSTSDKTATPTISGVNISFDYTAAKEHYRAGVVVDDGVSYVGAFRQPGNRGHFYAISADLGETYWDFADVLDSTPDSERTIYTTNTSGTTRLDFTLSNAKKLKATLNVGSNAQAQNVIAWQRSARFGLTQNSRLGAIENSTPAVIGPPGLPIWYPRADQATREKVDAFIKKYKARHKIVLFGARDGAVHAVRTLPTDVNDSINGTEAWAFIPAKVAYNLGTDMVSKTSNNYPDGSPTVADVILDDDEVHTVAIISGGNGSKSLVALDITETISADGSTILGPQPLWHIVPGGASAGRALSKPVVARVKVADESRFYAIMATGIAPENPVAPFTMGRDVVAVDIATGDVVWQFQSKCAVTSDIVIFETDDTLEADASQVDGYIDRAVWADACGNVYKVNPAQNVGSSYLKGYGTIATGHVDPDAQPVKAIFATASSTCALGAERPIVGTIGARSDPSGRFALFFGTGGIESYDPSKNNDFYAVYADTGEIRGCADGTPEKGRVQGTCTAGVCEKFYGGVVVSASDIIVTRATDAPVGTGTCEFGSSAVAGFSISEFGEEFNVTTNSATVSSLYGDGGSIYFATLSGDIVRIGTPRAGQAGDDTANNGGGGQADEDNDGDGASSGGMSLLGWRMVQ